MADPLGRKHTTIHKPKNRWQMDRVCEHVMKTSKWDFESKPSLDHIYFDAYAVYYGTDAAFKMLNETREKNERE